MDADRSNVITDSEKLVIAALPLSLYQEDSLIFTEEQESNINTIEDLIWWNLRLMLQDH